MTAYTFKYYEGFYIFIKTLDKFGYYKNVFNMLKRKE